MEGERSHGAAFRAGTSFRTARRGSNPERGAATGLDLLPPPSPPRQITAVGSAGERFKRLSTARPYAPGLHAKRINQGRHEIAMTNSFARENRSQLHPPPSIPQQLHENLRLVRNPCGRDSELLGPLRGQGRRRWRVVAMFPRPRTYNRIGVAQQSIEGVGRKPPRVNHASSDAWTLIAGQRCEIVPPFQECTQPGDARRCIVQGGDAVDKRPSFRRARPTIRTFRGVPRHDLTTRSRNDARIRIREKGDKSGPRPIAPLATQGTKRLNAQARNGRSTPLPKQRQRIAPGRQQE